MLDLRVDKTSLGAKGDLKLTFEDGTTLVVHTSDQGYESYVVTRGQDQVII